MPPELVGGQRFPASRKAADKGKNFPGCGRSRFRYSLWDIVVVNQLKPILSKFLDLSFFPRFSLMSSKKRVRSFEEKEKDAKRKRESRAGAGKKELAAAAQSQKQTALSITAMFAAAAAAGEPGENASMDVVDDTIGAKSDATASVASATASSNSSESAASASANTAAPASSSAERKGHGANVWDKAWLTGERADWVQISKDGTQATCRWCIQMWRTVGAKESEHTSWMDAKHGCVNRKDTTIATHEQSKFHLRARDKALAKHRQHKEMASAQDQRIFEAYEGNFMIAYFQLYERVIVISDSLPQRFLVFQLPHWHFPRFQRLAMRLGSQRFQSFSIRSNAKYAHSDIYRVRVEFASDQTTAAGEDDRLCRRRAREGADQARHIQGVA